MATAQRTKLTELTWLTQASESRQPLDELRPIWVRQETILSGPFVHHPERHPYCEFGANLRGEQMLFVKGEQIKRLPGDLLLIGPGVPHYAQIISYPHQLITVYFLPSVLIELGPERDGARMLQRFTAPGALSHLLVRPPPSLQLRFIRDLADLAAEFEHLQVGAEMRLRSILVEMLVRLFRWEQSQAEEVAEPEAIVDWQVLSRALRYLQTHFTESIYARDVAAAAGVCRTRLEQMFRHALGTSWINFLRNYRIERAAALLNDPRCRIIDAAMAVGFDSLSNFNASFRAFMKMTPTAYQKTVWRQSVKTDGSAPAANPIGGA